MVCYGGSKLKKSSTEVRTQCTTQVQIGPPYVQKEITQSASAFAVPKTPRRKASKLGTHHPLLTDALQLPYNAEHFHCTAVR